MKLIQISDIHLMPPGQDLRGLNPQARLEACIADINARQADADFCIFTGDLANAGDPEAYLNLRSCLNKLQIPYFLAIGNHDSRQQFCRAFPEVKRDVNDFYQYAIDHPEARFLVLDTVEEGAHWGAYCATRAGWLDQQLADAAGKRVYIFMHHPPFDIGLPSQDNLRIKDPQFFAEVIGRHRNVKHIFHGHVHRPVCGSWRGIPVSALRGTNHQVQFDLQTVAPIPLCHEPPAYAMILLRPDQTIIHFHDYLDQSGISESQSSEFGCDLQASGSPPIDTSATAVQ